MKRIDIKNELINNKQVRIIGETLNEIQYNNQLCLADFLVLPYRKYIYKSRLSGLAIESAINAIPIITTEDTWLSWSIDQFGSGIKVPENDPVSLANAIIYGHNNKSTFKDYARKRSSLAREYNSKERFLSLLWSD